MRASDRAYAALRDDIIEWRLLPGTVLAEVEQSERLGISRTCCKASTCIETRLLKVARRGRRQRRAFGGQLFRDRTPEALTRGCDKGDLSC